MAVPPVSNRKRLKSLLLSIGRKAGEVLMNQPQVRQRVDEVTERWRGSRENVEAWLTSVEDDLWIWIRRMQEQAHHAQSHIDRIRHSEQYYRTLGLRPGASMDEIKVAWRQAMRENHPDRFAHDPKAEERAHRRSQELNQAYAELSALLNARGQKR